MTQYKYVVIGGGMAGGRACEGIRELDSAGTIALVTQEPYRPYERPPLSKKYLRREVGLEKVYLKEAGYYAEQRIELIEGLRVEKLEKAKKQIVLADGRTLEYDKLLLATGGRARTLSIPGNNLGNVYTLRTIPDSDHIHDLAVKDARALIMGGSFIGAEVAASLNQLGLQVTEIFPGKRLFEKIMPAEVSDYIGSVFEEHGIHLLPGVTAKALEGDQRVQRAVLDNGDTLDADLVVMGVGIDLNTELARDAGLQLQDRDKAVIVDEFLRTSDRNIYAAGDIAAWPDPISGHRLRLEHWDVAREQGFQAGRNMAGAQEAYAVLPNFFSDLFDMSFDVWGDLSAWDQSVLRGSPDSRSFALFYFAQGRLAGALVMGRPKEEQKAIQSLIKAHPEYSDIARALADENRPVAGLVAERAGGARS